MLTELDGEAGEAVRKIQQRFDPKLAKLMRPHITLVGSSGLGPIPTDTPVEAIRTALAPIANITAPMTLHFEPPHRFMQTDIVSLPLNPHGPLRTLHELIGRSSLPFKAARFRFTPHCTLSFYPTLTQERERELRALRVSAPVYVDRLQVCLTRDPQPSQLLFELPLTG